MQKAVICITVVFLAAITLIFGWFGYPVAAQNDGAWFIVPAIRLAEVHQLDNPIDWVATGVTFDPSGGSRFVAYPPLFEIVLHYFISPGSAVPPPLQAFIAIAFMNAVAIALSAWALYMIATMKGKPLTWPAVIIICAALLLVLRASWSFNGRPEVLLRLLFTLGVVLFLRMRQPLHRAAALGVVLGLMAATHVLGPVFFFALMVFFFCWGNDLKTSLKYIGLSLAAGLATFGLVMQLSPYSIAETIQGIWGIGIFALVRDVPKKPIFALFFKNPILILGGITVAGLLFFPLRRFLHSKKINVTGSAVLQGLSVLLVGAYTVFCIIDIRKYYLMPFILLVPAGLLYYIVHVSARNYIKYSSALIFAFLVASMLKPLILFPPFLADGMNLYEARAQFANIVKEDSPARIELLGSHMWVLSESYDKMIAGEALAKYQIPKYMLLREEGEAPEAPQELGPCMLTHNFYTFKKPTLFGIRLANTTPGYNFAVYDCHAGK